MAAISSWPSILMESVQPLLAASIITDMILLPSTSFSLKVIFTLLEKAEVVDTNLAAARACNPNLLMMVAEFSSILYVFIMVNSTTL